MTYALHASQGDSDALASSSEAMEWILTSLVRVPEASELPKVDGTGARDGQVFLFRNKIRSPF